MDVEKKMLTRMATTSEAMKMRITRRRTTYSSCRMANVLFDATTAPTVQPPTTTGTMR